jgi:hypothetical protein
VAGVVGREEDVPDRPQLVVLGERFGVGNVQGSPAERGRPERVRQGAGVDDAAAGDVYGRGYSTYRNR